MPTLVLYKAGTNTTTVAKHLDYDAFGNVVSDSAPAVGALFRYTGRFVDPLTRKQWNLNRWYDGRTGRWLSQDPIGFAAGDANLNRYVGNGPTNYTDPSGLAPCDDIRAKIANQERALQDLRRKAGNLRSEIQRQYENLVYDPQSLPQTAPGDDKKPSLSVDGHLRLIQKYSADLQAVLNKIATHERILSAYQAALQKCLEEQAKCAEAEKAPDPKRSVPDEPWFTPPSIPDLRPPRMAGPPLQTLGGGIAIAGLGATGVLLLDDITLIGVVDDPAVPFTAAAAAGGGAIYTLGCAISVFGK